MLQLARLVCAGVLLAVLALPSVAAPQAGDAVTRFLQDSGLIEAGTSTATTTPPPPGLLDDMRNRASDLVLDAMDFLGVPYRFGGTSVETGFDCSGFTRHVFETSIGFLLPRVSSEQATSSNLLAVRQEELKPGDLVFFNTMRRAFSHVGIYVGNGKFVHAPRTGMRIRVENMSESYWLKRFNGARRVPGLNPQALSTTLQSYTSGAAQEATPGEPQRAAP